MRKVQLFVALLLSVFVLTAQAKVVKDSTLTNNSWIENSGKKTTKKDDLAVLTFEQVAKLNPVKRTEYIALIRKSFLDLERIQKSFKGRQVLVGLEAAQKNEFYAYTEALLFAEKAYAQSNDRNQCIYALNVSKYPDEQVKDGRAPFQCLLTKCTYGKQIAGVRCGFTASGMVNKPGVGCLPLEKATDGIDFNKIHASKSCWDHREGMTAKNKSNNDALLRNSEQLYGFKSGVIAAGTCKSDQSRQMMNGLIENSYDHRVYAQLIKVAYLCQMKSGGLPDGLINPDGDENVNSLTSNSFNFEKMVDDWSGLNEHAKKMFRQIAGHCQAPLSSSVVRDIETGANLKKVPKNSEPYEMEVLRQKYLQCTKDGTPKADMNDEEQRTCKYIQGKKPSSATVLEVEECRHAFLTWNNLNEQLKDIRGTLPREEDTNIPEVPEGPANGEIVDIEPTGCSENVARQESQLAQSCSRSLICMIQSHEARKTKDGTYRPSRKFVSLMSTMALACGDGVNNDTTLNSKLLNSYWMAFGHCSRGTYDWRGTENAGLVESWSEKKGKEGFWKRGGGKKDSAQYPDKNGEFAKAYGLSFETAKQLFCDPNGKKFNYNSSSESSSFIKARREQFNQQKRVLEKGQENSIADNLYACMNEASKNAAAFYSGSNMCYAVGPASNNTDEAFVKAQDSWLKDGAPTVLDRGGSCYIAKQIERYKLSCDGKTGVCYDKNRDGKDDKAGCACGPSKTYMVYVEPGFADREYRVEMVARENGQLEPAHARRPGQGSTNAEWMTYLNDNSCAISAKASDKISTSNKSAQ